MGSIPGKGAMIQHASRPKNQNIEQKEEPSPGDLPTGALSLSEAAGQHLEARTEAGVRG